MFQDILYKEDLKTISMLMNEESFVVAEKMHDITNVKWDLKLQALENENEKENFFNNEDLKVISLLIRGTRLNPAEKRHYFAGSGFEDKIKHLSDDWNKIDTVKAINKKFSKGKKKKTIKKSI